MGCQHGNVLGLFAHLDEQADVQFLFAHGVEAVEFLCQARIDAVQQLSQLAPVLIAQTSARVQAFLDAAIDVGREDDRFGLLALGILDDGYLIILV